MRFFIRRLPHPGPGQQALRQVLRWPGGLALRRFAEDAFAQHPRHFHGHRVQAPAAKERDVAGCPPAVGIPEDVRPDRGGITSGRRQGRVAALLAGRPGQHGDQPFPVRQDRLRQRGQRIKPLEGCEQQSLGVFGFAFLGERAVFEGAGVNGARQHREKGVLSGHDPDDVQVRAPDGPGGRTAFHAAGPHPLVVGHPAGADEQGLHPGGTGTRYRHYQALPQGEAPPGTTRYP